jgi:hypothetical protein
MFLPTMLLLVLRLRYQAKPLVLPTLSVALQKKA